MSTVDALPSYLIPLLQKHRSTYAPQYPKGGNSDHGPMTYMAMHALGFSEEEVCQFAVGYQTRLCPLLADTGPSLSEASWLSRLGDINAYASYMAFFDDQIARKGWRIVVQDYLPTLISGWYKDAYHGMIRLGYGIAFQVDCEVAAGLAYMAALGNDETLEDIAMQAEPQHDPLAYYESLRHMAQPSWSTGRFSQRCQEILANAPLHPMVGTQVIETLSQYCLALYAHTRDFFAMHLVTSSHAFILCDQVCTGQNWDRLYSLGVAVGMVAIGAPPWTKIPSHHAKPLGKAAYAYFREKGFKDEHEVKLQHSCAELATIWNNDDYFWVAREALHCG